MVRGRYARGEYDLRRVGWRREWLEEDTVGVEFGWRRVSLK